MLKPRASIQNMNPYHSPILGRDGLNLDLNENLAGCSAHVLQRLRTLTAREVAHYPQREEGERLVAAHLGLPPEQVLLTNGADEALALLFSAYLGPGDELLFAEPTFVMYPVLGQATGATVVNVRSGEDLSLPATELVERISPRTRVIAIANPNNPTGMLAPRASLLRILDSAANTAVLLDEAYFEFSRETMIGDLGRYRNLFVARTFSKVYGLAGLRLGVLTGSAEQIRFIRSFCPPFNVNAAALACLEVALADQQFVHDYVEQTKTSCRQIEGLCGELGLQFWPSSTNFVLIRIGSAAKAFVAALGTRGIVIRDFSTSPGCEGCVRITAGTREQMETVLKSFRESWAEVAASGR